MGREFDNKKLLTFGKQSGMIAKNQTVKCVDKEK